MSNGELGDKIREGLLSLGYVYNIESIGFYNGNNFTNGNEDVYITVDLFGDVTVEVYVYEDGDDDKVNSKIYTILDYFNELNIKLRKHKLKNLLKH